VQLLAMQGILFYTNLVLFDSESVELSNLLGDQLLDQIPQEFVEQSMSFLQFQFLVQ